MIVGILMLLIPYLIWSYFSIKDIIESWNYRTYNYVMTPIWSVITTVVYILIAIYLII